MRIEAGTIVAQKYQLLAPLARGGMGAVWVARHVKLGSRLAVKFLDPRLAASPSFVVRFEREARAAATIQSPHVVQVLDFGVEDGTPYLVMELLRGEDLRTRLRRVGRMPLIDAAAVLVQVGKALRRAHEAGIVHRDIKPGNLFVARIEDEEIVKVLDFGIAKEQDCPIDDCTRTGEIVGSPHYVSPEQGRGDKDVDQRTDVWSLGVIAYRMVTGNLPFPGEGLGNVLAKVLTEPPPKVQSFVSSLPASLDDFFARALAKKKEERFQSVRELVEAFVAIARNDAAEEEGPSTPSWSKILPASLLLPEGARPADVPSTSSQAPSCTGPAGSSEPDSVERVGQSSGFDTLTPSARGMWSPRRAPGRRWWAVGAAVAVMLGGAIWLGIGPAPEAPSSESSAPAGLSAPERIGTSWVPSTVLPSTSSQPWPAAAPAPLRSAAPPGTFPGMPLPPAPWPASPAGEPSPAASSAAPPHPSGAPTSTAAPVPGTRRKWGF